MTKHFVSVYEFYPVYHPEEGGYYQHAQELVHSIKVGSLKSARRVLRKMLRESEYAKAEQYSPNFAVYHGKYIGEGFEIRIETKKGNHTIGYEIYQ